MYHISDLKKFINCPKLYYYSLNDSNSFMEYLRNDNSLVELFSRYFNIDKYYEGKRGDDPKVFLDNINNYEWFFNARLCDDELRIKAPLLHKKSEYFEAYFVLYKTNVKELDITNYRMSVGVLRNNGLMVEKVYVIYLNPDYVFKDELNVKELFLIEDKYKNEEIIDVIDSGDFNYRRVIDEMNNNSIENYESLKNKNCRLKNNCIYYDLCFKEETNLPDDNIMTLVSSQHKNKMFENGITLLKDVDIELLEGNRVQYAQIMASKNNGQFIDKQALKKWLMSFSDETISFIDFEWDRYLVPVYNGMKPMDVVCFEFALYYLENGKLEHRTFIGTHDCREEFIKALIDYLPKKGPILAYNAFGAEVLRIQELAKIYPNYSIELDNIANRFIDLSTPFIEGLVYDIRMRGNFTVKKLVSIVSDKTYEGMNVNDGMKAVYSWRNIDKGLTIEEDKVKEDLEDYCSLDAYSLVLIYKWLLELAIT